MWITYESCKLEELTAKSTGNKYTAFALRGTKRGFRGAADEPYVKPLFENTTISVKEKGVWRHGVSAIQYLQKACQPGDLLELKFNRSVTPPELMSIENKATNVPTYEPLSDEEAARLQAASATPTVQTQAPAPGYAQHAAMPTPGQHSAIPF